MKICVFGVGVIGGYMAAERTLAGYLAAIAKMAWGGRQRVARRK